ncbi:MAG: dTDP-4-dehydrorhamnose reductase [Gammaproteobacteria bacterium]|jgi:dTDP-4-dehydrorhamnose reductase|nr:dTDP-4-dehydrorhamnose reductase [Gammaproteobacteria bacterium]
MKILITGANGQLGRSLQDTRPAGIELIACDSTQLDLSNPAAVRTALGQLRPQLIVNAGAYTAVDTAESEPEQAALINGTAVTCLADYCREHDARLIQISTDFVFSGTRTTPWEPDAMPAPISVYGRTKRAGEVAAQALGAAARVVRTSWVYSEHGHNFVKTMLQLAADRDELTVVDDQTGSPTYARHLADAIWQVHRVWPAQPIVHYSDSGAITWRDFAVAIFAEGVAAGLLSRAPRVVPTTTSAYGAPAPRPPYTVLDTATSCAALGIVAPPWRDALREMLGRLAESGWGKPVAAGRDSCA